MLRRLEAPGNQFVARSPLELLFVRIILRFRLIPVENNLQYSLRETPESFHKRRDNSRFSGTLIDGAFL